MFSVLANSNMEQPTSSLKNCTYKCAFKNQIKSHLLASKLNFLIKRVKSFKLIIYEYISHLVLLTLENFSCPISDATLSLIEMLPHFSQPVTKPSVFYIAYCNVSSCFNKNDYDHVFRNYIK